MVLIVQPPLLPRKVPLIAGITAFLSSLSARFLARALREIRATKGNRGTSIIVFGAGNAGRLLVQNLINDPLSEYRPVAFLDDDRAKQRRRISGVLVRGRRADLLRVAPR